MKFDKNDIYSIIENALAWIVTFAMFIYGTAKSIQFKGAANTHSPPSELEGMALMWAFYGYSHPYALTLGALEITGGILILLKRTRLIGCLFLSTILVNIILQDIFFGVHVGALKAAILYQICILIILWFHRDKMIHAIRSLLLNNNMDRKRSIRNLMLAFGLFIVLRIMEYYITIGWN